MLKVMCKSGKSWNLPNVINLILYLCNRILDADILLKPWKSPLRTKSKCTRMSRPEQGAGFPYRVQVCGEPPRCRVRPVLFFCKCV